MSSKGRLAEYRAKRGLRRRLEPGGGRANAEPVFLVQRHDAFDFRPEIGGVLVSWPVPKCPSLNPSDGRLAIRAGDHPLDYARFEGSVPAGEYGGGTVIGRDTGTFELALEEGVGLHGEKLRGTLSLLRRDSSGQEQWRLSKKDDEGAGRRRKLAKTQLTGCANRDLE
ncbi:DNA polymerase ligase N-terminal domain-containing protein [Amycolatopsis rubida]|uniref:Bifunctional non-homologous end joining protein LigD n=1 Tax=Amycolatopsis rubida TaxID=112413 RepID=A0A1I5KD51_9PSEU|nr:DNA polymerase ligase N-terminal domain-containing protein [Amycolatopsis rubida]SFO82937.1 bifunctional non-homologous end joining protein LigD [Amycolatopsis rubida]